VLGSPFIIGSACDYLPRSSYRSKSKIGSDYAKNFCNNVDDYHKSSTSMDKKKRRNEEVDGCNIESKTERVNSKEKRMVIELIDGDADEFLS